MNNTGYVVKENTMSVKQAAKAAAVVTVILLLAALPAIADDYNYDMTTYVSCSSHIDAIWQWLEPESRDIVYNTFSSLSGLMYLYDGTMPDDNPVHYVQTTPVFYEWLAEDHPEIMADIHFWHDRGQWHITGGMYLESDSQLPSGESLVRQHLYGQRYFMEEFGHAVKVGFLPDSFGYPATLPTILAGAGIEGFVSAKINWNDTNVFPFHVFDWLGPDGSRVPTYLTVGHYNDYIDEAVLRATMRKSQDFHPDIDVLQMYLGVGDHGGGTFKPWIDRVVELRDEKGYDIVFGTHDLFFEALKDQPVDNWWADELYLEYHRGCYTNRAEVKRRNRYAEIGLEAVEKLWVLASDLGGVWPRATLDDAWRIVLFNQFHDILPGSSIEDYYTGQFDREMGWVETSLNDLGVWGLQRLSENVDTSFARDLEASMVFVAFNPLSFKRDAVVRIEVNPPDRWWNAFDSQGNLLPTQWSEHERALLVRLTDLPPLGWYAFVLRDSDWIESQGVNVQDLTMNNGLIQVVLDPATGHVVSLQDLQNGTEAIEPGRPANVIQLYKEKFNSFPAWNLVYDKYGTEPIAVDDLTALEVLESGPVRARIRLTRTYEELEIVQHVILDAGADHATFETTINNWGQVQNRLAKIAFPLNLANDPAEAIYDIPYGTLVRRHDESPPYNYEALGHKWAAVQDSSGAKSGSGVGLLSGDKYGFDIQNDRNGQGISDGRANILRLTVLKASTSPLPGVMTPSFGGPVGDRGTFTTLYGLRPYTGGWTNGNMVQAGWRFNMAPLVGGSYIHEGSLPAQGSWAEVDQPNVLITALKRPWEGPDQGSIIVRLLETRGIDGNVTLRLPGRRITQAQPVDLVERPVDDPAVELVEHGACTLWMGHNSLATLLIQAEPLGPADDDDHQGDDDDDDSACGCN